MFQIQKSNLKMKNDNEKIKNKKIYE